MDHPSQRPESPPAKQVDKLNKQSPGNSSNDPIEPLTNVCQLIADVSRENHRPALVMPESTGQSITFSELWKSACCLSNGLANRGLAQGDRVIIMIPMSIDLYISLLAVVKMGAVAVFVDPWIPAKRMAAFANFAEPKAFLGIGKSHWLRFMEPRLRSISISVTTGRCFAGFPARFKLERLKSAKPDWSLANVAPTDSALITFTSGSSGEPKGANRTHRFLNAQHHALQHEFPTTSSDVDMPMFPIFALNNLVSGVTSVIPDMDFQKVAEVDGDKIARQIQENKVSTCTASPPFLDRLCDSIERDQRITSLRRVLTGGAPVSDRQLERWNSILPGTEILIAYGSTEAEPVSHISSAQRLTLKVKNKGYCVGVPSELIRTRVIKISRDPKHVVGKPIESLELPDAEIGELTVAGTHVCQDYFKNPKANEENKLTDEDGIIWHRMGDTGSFDNAGRFWLVGRVHSTIVREGISIHPQLVEQKLSNLVSGLLQVSAVGIDDEKLGQQLWIVCRLKPNDRSTQVAAKESIRNVLENESCSVDKIMFVDWSFPVDPRHNTKIDYQALKARL